MPGISIVAVMDRERKQHSIVKLRRRTIRDASDPLSSTPLTFIANYRLNQEAFIMVLENIEPLLKSSTIPAIIQLATALSYLATGAFQRVIGKDVDLCLGRSTVSTILWRVINAIERKICPHWIQLQMSPEEKTNSKIYFFEKYQIPGIIGCIDGTHVKMYKPSEDESLFYNRKGTFSINAMIICDYDMKVRAVDACRPGSSHDAFVWSLSGARNHFLNEYENGDTNSWLLGDSGYGLEPFLITPYKSVTRGSAEHKFNKQHTLARNIVERTIGVLKSRFRCLQGTLVYVPGKCIKIINVSCALHNICREYNIDFEVDFENDQLYHENDNDEVYDSSVDENFDINLYNIGRRIRDNIANEIN